MSEYKKPKRRILHKFKMEEISPVTRPAMEGAKSLIIKAGEVAKREEGGKEFSAEDYAYVPDPRDPSTWELRLSAEPGGDPDPSLVETAVAALSKGLFEISEESCKLVEERVRRTWLMVNPDKSSEDYPATNKQEETMSKERTVEELNAELAISKAYGEFNDSEKAHYNSLDDAGKSAFIKMDKASRDGELKKATDNDPEVYRADDGTIFRKSDDPRLVKMAQDSDKTSRELRKERESRETLEFTKRADSELKYLPGETLNKVALLKAVDKIEDKGVREAVTSILKAHCANFEAAFKTAGSGGASEPVANLETMAKKHQASNPTLSYEQAYDAVIQTPEGKKLYDQTLS